jgi:transposase InsO family protein
LTIVPIVAGFWTTWLPFALLQCWPFCWWIAAVVDHFARRVMGPAVWKQPPTSQQVRGVLGRTIRTNGAKPKYIFLDWLVQIGTNAASLLDRAPNVHDLIPLCSSRHTLPDYFAAGLGTAFSASLSAVW